MIRNGAHNCAGLTDPTWNQLAKESAQYPLVNRMVARALAASQHRRRLVVGYLSRSQSVVVHLQPLMTTGVPNDLEKPNGCYTYSMDPLVQLVQGLFLGEPEELKEQQGRCSNCLKHKPVLDGSSVLA